MTRAITYVIGAIGAALESTAGSEPERRVATAGEGQGELARVHVALELRVRVLGADGSALEGARVFLCDPTWRKSAWASAIRCGSVIA